MADKMDEATRRRMLADLAKAAKLGDVVAAKALFAKAEGQPEPFAWGTQALRVAAEEGHVDMIQALLDVSDPKAYDSQALLSAAENGRLEAVKFLIPLSNPVARGSVALKAAARCGHERIVEELIGFEHKTESLDYALDFATRAGHAGVVDVLLDKKRAGVDAQGKAILYFGEKALGAALAEAARQARPDIVALIDPWVYERAARSRALVEAAKIGFEDIVEMLLPGSDVDFEGLAPLRAAAGSGNAQLVGMLLRPESFKGIAASQALARAAAGGHARVVDSFLALGLDAIYWGEAISEAAKGGHIRIVETLMGKLAENADSANEKVRLDDSEHCAIVGGGLVSAAAGGHLDIVNMLVESSSMERRRDAIEAAVVDGQEEIVAELVGWCDVLSAESKALSKAAWQGNVELVRMLLPLSYPLARGSEALRDACLEGNAEVVEVLARVSDASERCEYPPDIEEDISEEMFGSKDGVPADFSMVMAAVYGDEAMCVDAVCQELEAGLACRLLKEAIGFVKAIGCVEQAEMAESCYARQEARLLAQVARPVPAARRQKRV